MVSRGAYYSEHIFMGFIMNIYVIFVLLVMLLIIVKYQIELLRHNTG